MSKLVLDLMVPPEYDRSKLAEIVRVLCNQVNQLSEGRLNARYNAQVSVPSGTAAAYAVGDFVPDSHCTVRGSIAPGVAASFVRIGWICTASGTPGTFQEVRVATGA